jgi:hypothetical protein
MKLKAVFLVLVVFSCETLRAGESSGDMWRSFTKNERLIMALGMMMGTDFGEIYLLRQMHSLPKTKDCFSVAESAQKEIKSPDNLSPEQLRDGLDEFYADYRNRSLDFVWGLVAVRDGIRGTPKADIEKMLEGARKLATGTKPKGQ